MKKVGITLLTAFLGGAVALGGYKLITKSNQNAASITEKQNVYFASNIKSTGEQLSSAGTPDFISAAAAVTPAVVHIEVKVARKASKGNTSIDDFFGDFFGGGGMQMPQQPKESKGSGSGVILTPDGYIVTNNHVVENATEVSVILTDKRRFKAKVIGTDPNTDVALIKIEAEQLPIVKLGDSDQVKVGEWVLAVGYPLDLNTTVTAGIVSAKRRKIDILNRDQMYKQYQEGKPVVSSGIESFIQTDAAINPGNSGGALVNTNGELIGINAAIASRTGNFEGYGFAIPIDLAKKVVEDLKKYGKVRRGYIGVSFQELNSEIAKSLNITDIDGLYVNEVQEGSSAAAAGLKKGDIIKKVNGQIIISSADLQERVGRLNPGDKINIAVKRAGKEKEYNLVLKEAPQAKEKDNTENTNSSKKALKMDDLGATFAPLSAKLKARFGLKNGLVINSVSDRGILGSYEIEEGSIVVKVNGVDVNSVEDIKNGLAKGNNSLDLWLLSPDGAKQRITINNIN